MSDRIADCAVRVIASDGLDALSFRRVAAAADVAIGTVQHHFPCRSDLVAAAFERTAARQAVRAMAARRGPTWIATLTNRLSALLPADESGLEEAVVWVALAAAAGREPVLGERRRRLVAETVLGMARLLDRSVDAGESRSGTDTAELAERVDAVLEGFLLQAAAGGSVVDRNTVERFVSVIEAICNTGLAD